MKGVRKGEHIVPDALGARLTRKWVCKKCNGDFSILDRELVSYSPLALVVQQELGTESGLLWDYHPGLDLALEARVMPKYQATVLWPQLVFLGEKVLFTFDQDEAESVGLKRYAQLFKGFLDASVLTLTTRPKRPSFRWQKIPRAPDRGRYPPRVFTPHRFDEWKKGMTFICRFYGTVDKGRTLHQARAWKPIVNRQTATTGLGVYDPEAGMSFRPDFVLRALIKIGINLLAYLRTPDEVNERTFTAAIRFVRFGTGMSSRHLRGSGFILGGDLANLRCPDKCHVFELTWDGGMWSLIACFFGARVGACVSFPGPRASGWVRAEVIAPVGSSDWTVCKSPILIPREIRTTWTDESKMIPSLAIRHRGSKLRYERAKPKPR